MPVNLPIDIIDLIVQYSTTSTCAHISAVSRNVYSISVRTLYASIPEMSITRATRCLLTLSKNPELALRVRKFSFHLSSSSRALPAFFALLSLALSNMRNLNTLLLDMEAPIPTNLLEQISSRLTKLVLAVPPRSSYPISQFLSNQPAIEELFLVCRSEDLSTLGPEALPLLRELSAPLWILVKILPSRLSHMSQLAVLGVMNDPDDLIILGMILTLSDPPESLALIIDARITMNRMPIAAISRGLSFLGRAAPFVSFLLLKKYGDHIKKDELQEIFVYALPSFPKLKNLILMSQSPAPTAYTSDPQAQPAQTPSSMHSLLRNALAYVYSILVNIPSLLLSLFSSRYSAPQVESNQTQSQPSPSLDALHDLSCHLQIVKAWGQIHPGLECVMFPVGTYRLRKSGDDYVA
ncbi:hypothetical protein RSOL_449230 [Rhizoctonia solani AG-3 Rhs1AP]|uniref:F-box domain-containing protein n=1 Tax=Rhizoctonia solani AG-3 Rhs1AP TaxID=1086054 RepID=X8JR12_9AGAM|nr:hypothetical protein RSOL_449230 [Rhizoctonia solani AG-3 Rhs1AP]